MKLVFYSGGTDAENRELSRATLELAGKTDPALTFIPSCSYYGESDFRDYVSQFRPHGVRKFLYFPIDIPFDEVLESEVLNSDIIHLGGGNTYYFLKHLRKSKFLPKLKAFVKKGGVLTGLSAGAIMMTPSIATAGFPSFDCDENGENLKNLKALGLVPFEFFPHYRNSIKYDRELVKVSKEMKHPLYLIPDGSGIIVNNKEISFCGKSWMAFAGKKSVIVP